MFHHLVRILYFRHVGLLLALNSVHYNALELKLAVDVR